MFSRRIQQQARHLVMLIMQPLARVGITPNMLTIIGLLLSILTAFILAQGWLLVGGLLVLFAGVFDMFDGAMARVTNTATTFGAFLDSTLDRYSESIILVGLLYYALMRPDLSTSFWPFPNGQAWMITSIYIAVVGSLMVSYAKARAEGLGLECKTGLLARPERVILLAIGLLSGAVIWALILLAVLSNVTAIERIVYVWRTTRRRPGGIAASDVLISEEDAGAGSNEHHVPTVVATSEVKEPSVRPLPTSVPPFNGGRQQE